MTSLAIALLIGVLTAYFAKNRGKSPLLWFFIGTFFGIFGFIALFFFPTQKQEVGPEKETAQIQEMQKESPFKDTSWFYADKAYTQQGPVPFNELVRLWKQNEVSQETYVWSQGMKEWKRIGEDQLLQEVLKGG